MMSRYDRKIPLDAVLVRLSLHTDPRTEFAFDTLVSDIHCVPDELPRLAEKWAAEIREKLK